MDVFDSMTDLEWALMCRAGTHEGWIMQAELTQEEKKSAEGLVRAGWLWKTKVQGFWWFTQNPPLLSA